MRFKQSLGLTLFFITVFVISAVAQGDPRLVAPVGHISQAGGFGISLPNDVTAQRMITPSQGTKGGMQYFWRTGDGEFFVSFYDNSEQSENPRQELEQLRDNYLSGVVKNGGRNAGKKDLTLDKYPGLELRATLKSKEVVIIRYYSVGKRIFVISTRLNSSETGEKQLKILDSFRLVTNSKD